ncbi:MAG: hypothetical protein JXQ73_14940 [Phycisphaerae bacterium]|nr:hypothetical protein [Phycisphaerae bacterium]
MSGIPPDIPASVLLAGLQQHNASGAQDSEVNQRISIARKVADKAAQREQDVVADEGDMTVTADRGGLAGQGRNFAEGEEEHQEHHETPHEDAEGITQDDTGHFHVDLEA